MKQTLWRPRCQISNYEGKTSCRATFCLARLPVGTSGGGGCRPAWLATRYIMVDNARFHSKAEFLQIPSETGILTFQFHLSSLSAKKLLLPSKSKSNLPVTAGSHFSKTHSLDRNKKLPLDSVDKQINSCVLTISFPTHSFTVSFMSDTYIYTKQQHWHTYRPISQKRINVRQKTWNNSYQHPTLYYSHQLVAFKWGLMLRHSSFSSMQQNADIKFDRLTNQIKDWNNKK